MCFISIDSRNSESTKLDTASPHTHTRTRTHSNKTPTEQQYHTIPYPTPPIDRTEDGEEKVVAIVKKLSFFGEVGLVIHLPRTSTVTARKKCLFLELSQSDFRNFTVVAPEVLEAFRDRLEDYNIALRYLIHNPILQEYLLKFMMEEKSAENLQFWIPAKDFRLSDNKDPDAIRSEANEIVDRHIKEGAELQVNIQGTTRKEITAGLKGQINRYVRWCCRGCWVAVCRLSSARARVCVK